MPNRVHPRSAGMFATAVAIVMLAAVTNAHSQSNLGFESAHSENARRPVGWNSSGGGACKIARDDQAHSQGEHSLHFKCRNPTGTRQFGMAAQSITLDPSKDGQIRLSGDLRLSDVRNGFGGLWLRIDGAKGSLAFNNMADRALHGTLDWARHEIRLAYPQGAKRAVFGALLAADGELWADDLTIEVVAADRLPEVAGEARRYLQDALAIIDKHALARPKNWEAYAAQVMQSARGASKVEEAYTSLQFALKQLGDGHSFLMRPERTGQWRSGNSDAEAESITRVEGRLLDGQFAYLGVPGFASGDPATMTAFADALQQEVARLDRAPACGWVVDLRNNPGGNMWPMIAGLGPLLGQEELGSFVDRNGLSEVWWQRDGRAGSGEAELSRVSGLGYRLANPQSPVAVLIGKLTASSGEALAIAFRGRPHTRSFGAATRGLATGNQNFALSDGAMLFLTTTRFRDRTGVEQRGSISPDTLSESLSALQAEPNEDATLDAAIQWLRQTADCASATPGDR